MAAPRAALEAERRAIELHKQVYGDPDAVQDTDQNQPDTDTQPPQGESPAPEAPAPAGQEQPVKTEEETGDDEQGDIFERYRQLEAAHKTLQGKYRAEVPRLSQQVRDLTQQLEKLQSQKETAEANAEEAQQRLADLNAQLRDEFGDEAATAVTDVARQVAREEAANARREAEESAQSRFWNTIDYRIPDFEQVNVDPKFIAWLQTPDPNTGFPYQDTLNAAGNRFDAATVVDVFNAYKRATTNPQPEQQQTLDPMSPEAQVAPSKRQGRSLPNQKPQYTPDDYTRLMREIERGEWRGREAEARALEEEIHAALTG